MFQLVRILCLQLLDSYNYYNESDKYDGHGDGYDVYGYDYLEDDVEFSNTEDELQG